MTPILKLTDPVLRVESVGKRFGARVVLKAATLYAYPGRVTALVGRNGSGKSTLLRIAAGVLAPDYGAIHFGGAVWTRPRLARLSRLGLFFVPEQGLLSRVLTLEQHLRIAGSDAHRRSAVLAGFDLDPLRSHYRHQLSGGERRRADLAVAALRAPSCLLADEPFLGIAPLDVERIAAHLRALRDSGSSIVVSGHEIRTILDVADEIVWLTSGTTHGFPTIEDALRNDQFRREYLGPDPHPML